MAFPAPDIPELTCRCGRWNNKIHCPACGGYAILGLGVKHNIAVQLPNTNDTVVVCSFKCRRCNIKFNDFEWRYKCEAPRYESATMQIRRLKDEAAEKVKLAGEDMKLTAMANGATIEQARHVAMAYMFYQRNPAMLKPGDLDELRRFLKMNIPRQAGEDEQEVIR